MSSPRPLRYAVLEITNRCNLHCAHCASSSGQARENELSFDEIRTVLAQIAGLGGQEVTVIGGEALLRGDWVAICREVRGLGMELILVSNGLLMENESVFQILRELRPLVIGISLDAADRTLYRQIRGVDGFDDCLRVLRRLVAEGHRQVNAITTFMRSNLEQFDALASLLEGSGIVWQVQIANHGGQRFCADQFISRDEYAWLAGKMREVFAGARPGLRLRHMDDFGYFPLDGALSFLHQTWRGCIAGVELIGIRSNGDVLGCLSLGDDFVEANLRQTPLPEIWHSRRFFSRFREKQHCLTGTCRTCPHARACCAGCSAIAYSATGALGCNPYCIRQIESEQLLAGLLGR